MRATRKKKRGGGGRGKRGECKILSKKERENEK